MPTELFQASNVSSDVARQFKVQAASEGLTKAQLLTKIFEFYITHGGPEWQKSSSMERPPTHRRVGARMKDSEEQSGTIVTEGRRKNSGAKAKNRVPIDPKHLPKGVTDETTR
jgi:hypothetical protein